MGRAERSKLEALNDISSIDITLDLEKTLQKILKITCETMKAHSGAILLVDKKTGNPEMAASFEQGVEYIHGVCEIAKKTGTDLSESPSFTALKTGECYIVSDIFHEQGNMPWHQLSKELGISSRILMPIKKENKAIGLLNIYMEDPYEFTEEEIKFVNLTALQTSFTVQNTKSYKKLKKNISELDGYRGCIENNSGDAYNKLFDSEKYLRTIIESSFDGIVVSDDKGIIEYGNKAFFSLTGWPKEELVGEFFIKMFPEYARENAFERYEELKKGIEIPFENTIQTRNGEIKNVYISPSSAIIKGETKYIGVIKDITEFKRLTINLKESEERYRDIFENANDPMYILDIQGKILKMNKMGLSLLGCKKEEVIGTYVFQWLTPGSARVIQERQAKRTSGSELKETGIIEVICKNGEHRWAEIRTREIKNKGRATRIHGIARDITEKMKMEHELKRSEERYKDLFENAQDPMYIHDPDGFFISVNKATLEEMGCSEEEIIGSHISQWLTPESLEYAMNTLMKHISGEHVELPIILEVVTKYGEHKWAEIRNRVIKEGVVVKEIHGIARDITEQKKMREELDAYHERLQRSYKELREADRLKTEFISNITHELFTPLTSIKGFAELMVDEILGEINDKQKDGFEIIIRNSDRLSRLIKELLDSTQIENDKLELILEPVSLNKIILNSVRDIELHARKKQIIIENKADSLPEITGDENRLTQVIINILSNAIKFTPEKGKITINANDEADKIKVSISDTGIGIPEDKLPYIFDRFYQADGSSKRKFGGVGLGLWICKTIIDNHNGSIIAESDRNGSTFHIELPVMNNI